MAADEIAIGSLVRSDDGQEGTVESIRGSVARVRVGRNLTTIAVEDLAPLALDPEGALRSGQFGSPTAFALRA